MNRIQEIKGLSEMEVSRKLKRIKQTFIGIPIIHGKDGYPYSLFTLTDFKPAMPPDLIEDMADLIIYYGDFAQADLIVSEADRGGGPLAHAVALRAYLPYTLANWYPTRSSGEITVKAAPGFSGNGYICLNGLLDKQKVILVDDLLSTGSTAVAILRAIRESGSAPLQTVFVAEKLGMGGRKEIEKICDIPIITLVQFLAKGTETSSPTT